jgi:hypothetical protein
MADSIDSLLARFKPSEKNVLQFLKGQQSQFNPLISTLLNQYRLSKEPSRVSKMYEEMIKGLPSQEKIGGAYNTAMQNLAGYMQSLDTTRGGQGVSDIIGSIGAGIGAAPGVSADLAQAAGTLSGVGAAGGDVMSKAILSGAGARMYGSATQQMQSAAENAMRMRMGLAESKDADKASRRALGLQLAQAKTQKAGAAPSMLELYSTLLGIRGQEKALTSSGGGGGGGSSTSIEDLIKSILGNVGGGGGGNQRDKKRNQVATQQASAAEWLRGAGSNIFG